MGFEYFKRPVRSVTGASTFDALTVENTGTLQGRLIVPTEALTASAALQNLSTEFASFITQGTSGAGRDFRLPAPVVGLVKFIAVNANTTSPPNTRIVTNTTLQTFFGSSFNEATVADSTVRSKYYTLLLVGASTTQWAVLSGSTTFWTFAATTGSTGQ